MGGGGSKENKIQYIPNKLTTKLLEHKRCIYMTFSEYKNNIFKPIENSILYIEKNVNVFKYKSESNFSEKDKYQLLKSFTDDNIFPNYKNIKESSTENKFDIFSFMKAIGNPDVTDAILDILNDLSYKYGKLALPVYVMYAKKLEYDGTYLDNWLKTNKKDDKFLQKYMKKDHSNNIFAKYIWKGNINLNIYFPNMDNKGRILTNLKSFRNQNMWMKSLVIDDDLLYSIYSVDSYDFERIKKSIPSSLFERLKVIIIEKNKKQYLFKHDQQNICYNHGCISEVGENLDSLIPGYSSSEVIMNNNVNSKSPYMPKKCLRPFDLAENGFGDNQSFYDELSNEIFKDDDDGCYNIWLKNKKLMDQNKVDELDTNIEPELMDAIDTFLVKYILENKREDNNYSKWNNKILKELGKRSQIVPGIQEFVLPLFKLKIDNYDIEKYFYSLPWGNKLLPLNYGLADGEENNNEIISSNGKFWMKIDSNGKLKMYNNGNEFYIFNNKLFGITNAIVKFENGFLNIYGLDKNLTQIQVFQIQLVKGVFREPLSLIINDNGKLSVFENGFYNVLDEDFAKNYNASLEFSINNKFHKNGQSYNEYIKLKKENLKKIEDNKEGLYKYNENLTKMIKRLLDIEKKFNNKF
jgi:hypothetical protein